MAIRCSVDILYATWNEEIGGLMIRSVRCRSLERRDGASNFPPLNFFGPKDNYKRFLNKSDGSRLPSASDPTRFQGATLIKIQVLHELVEIIYIILF